MTEEIITFTEEEIAAQDAARNANKEQALRYADLTAQALAKKMTAYKFYPRLIEAPEYNFIEIGIQPIGGSVMDQSDVAYSQMFFEEMIDKKVQIERTKRVYKDVRIMLGIPLEDDV
jgi:hypothetical protein